MKLTFYNDFQLGVIQDDKVIDASPAVNGLGHHSPQELLEMLITNWGELGPRISRSIQDQTGASLAAVKLCPPVPRPGQLVCLAGNYIEPNQFMTRLIVPGKSISRQM